MKRAIKYTPDQLDVARHALGLPNARGQSYRNRYVVAPGSPISVRWDKMRKTGAAEIRSAAAAHTNFDLYWLTRAGAEAALQPGETLDPEDFPAGPSGL